MQIPFASEHALTPPSPPTRYGMYTIFAPPPIALSPSPACGGFAQKPVI